VKRYQEIPNNTSSKDVNEVPFSRNSTTLALTGLVLAVEGVEQGAVHEIDRPDHGRWRNQELSQNTTKRKSNQLGGHNNKPLIREVPLCIVESMSNGDDVGGIGRLRTYRSSDGVQNVFFNGEWPQHPIS
jgi:hypothetical protein